MGRRPNIATRAGYLGLIVSLSHCLIVSAAEPQNQTAPSAKAESPLFMVKRGALVTEDDFSGPTYKEKWKEFIKTWTLVDGMMKGETEVGKHHSTLAPKKDFPVDRAVIQFDFKLDGAKSIGVVLNHETGYREHVASVSFSPSEAKLKRSSGMGKTTKSQELDLKPVKLDDGRWHTATIEIYDAEMLVSLDGKFLLHGIGVDPAQHTKEGPRFIVSDPAAYLDNVRVWKAEPDPTWAERKAKMKP